MVDGDLLVLDDLFFTLLEHDRIGIVAPNGSGKTTFLHIIMGLLAEIQIRTYHESQSKPIYIVRERVGPGPRPTSGQNTEHS